MNRKEVGHRDLGKLDNIQLCEAETDAANWFSDWTMRPLIGSFGLAMPV